MFPTTNKTVQTCTDQISGFVDFSSTGLALDSAVPWMVRYGQMPLPSPWVTKESDLIAVADKAQAGWSNLRRGDHQSHWSNTSPASRPMGSDGIRWDPMDVWVRLPRCRGGQCEGCASCGESPVPAIKASLWADAYFHPAKRLR